MGGQRGEGGGCMNMGVLCLDTRMGGCKVVTHSSGKDFLA